jgi:vancomycin permeability regulator SanA
MSTHSKNILIITIIAFLNQIILLFIKYYHNNLSVSEFSFSKTGNLISAFFLVLFLVGAILLYTKKDNLTAVRSNILLTFSAIYILPLFIILIFNFIDFKFANEYLFGYPLKKIIPIIFFVINQTVFVFILFLIWFMYLGYSLLAYLYSTIATILTIVILIFMTFFYTFFTSEFNLKNDQSKFEYGIILGAAVWSGNKPSPIFMGRIDKGAELYKKGIIRKIQLTGGNAPGELSEAKTAFEYLGKKYNLPKKDIKIEEITSTTNEQIKFIKNVLEKKYKVNNFLVISDQFHLKRVEEMANFYNLHAGVIGSDYRLNFQKSLIYRLRESVGLILFWFFAV